MQAALGDWRGLLCQTRRDLDEKGQYKEAKVLFLAVLDGRRRVLVEEHKKTLTSQCNMGIFLLKNIEDYKGALDYFQQAIRVMEKVLGKTYPDTLRTTMNIAGVYTEGLKDFPKAEEMYMLALVGFEKSVGKDHESTKGCARNLSHLLEIMGRHTDL